MTPETREGLMRAAQACAEAEIRAAAKMLQHIADDPGASEEEAWRWLDRASFACDCFFDSRLLDDDGRYGRDLAALASIASKACRGEHMAAIDRSFGRAA